MKVQSLTWMTLITLTFYKKFLYDSGGWAGTSIYAFMCFRICALTTKRCFRKPAPLSVTRDEMHMRIYIYIYIYIYLSLCAHAHLICVYACLYVCVCACVCECVYACVCVCVYKIRKHKCRYTQ